MNKGGVFIVGALIGFAAGVLIAPKSGAETRADAAGFARDIVGQGQDFYQQGTQRFKTSASSARFNGEQGNDQLQAKIDAARKIISEQVARNAEATRKATEEAAAQADTVEVESTSEVDE